jgi:hypothetical protein
MSARHQNELHYPKSGDTVSRILDEAQQRQHVLDMGGVEKLEPAEFHEGNIAAGQFNLQRTAVMRCAKEYRLLFQRGAGFAVLQHTLDNETRLVGLVAHVHQLRLLGGGSIGPEVLGKPLGRKINHGIGRRQDRLR